MHTIARAAFVALAATGMACGGSGTAFAFDHGHGATVEGGSSKLVGLFQQNIAQAHKQNTNCSNTEDAFNGPSTLAGARTAFRCLTGDASFNKYTVVERRGLTFSAAPVQVM